MIPNDYLGTLSPWLKKILSFAAPECSRMRNDFRVIAQKEGLFSGFPGFLGSHIPVSGFSGFSGFSGSARHPAPSTDKAGMQVFIIEKVGNFHEHSE